VAGADALDAAAAVEEVVVAGHDRVVSTLGVPYTREPVTIFSQGARNIVAAMNRHGLRRLVCVTSIGVQGRRSDPRADLADVLLREATDDQHVRPCIEVITTQGTPNYARVFLKEALHIGK
jgi:NAD(P)H-binding